MGHLNESNVCLGHVIKEVIILPLNNNHHHCLNVDLLSLISRKTGDFFDDDG